VVVWRDVPNVRARLIDVGGSPVGDDFVVGTNMAFVNAPDVAVRDDSFLVVWTDGGSDGDARSVSGRLYASDGTATGVAFVVNSYTTSSQSGAAVRVSPVKTSSSRGSATKSTAIPTAASR
jgi:hypothetical protein